MGFFNWSAPLFHRFSDRWDDQAVQRVSARLKPYVPVGGSLLDVGGGTGALARRLHDALDADVTVLDPTPEMIKYLPDTGPVRGVLGVAEAMPFDDASFDAIIVTDAFHHFRDQEGSVSEFARVVRPGGVVLVYELDPSGVLMRLVVLGERLLGEPGAFFTPEEMCSFMAKHGIAGDCSRENKIAYLYCGEVGRRGTVMI